MAIDLYDPRTMMEALHQAYPAQTFLRDLFFSNHDPVETEHIDIDIVKGGRKMAPFVHPMKSGTVMERDGYTTNSYKPAMIKPKRPATVVDWQKRLPGEAVYSGTSPAERASKLYTQDLMFLDEIITRREEWMCAKALFTGQVPQKGEGIDEVVAYPLTITTLDADDKFDGDSSAPLAYLRDVRRSMVQVSGIAPNTAVFGKEAFDAFLNNTEVQKYADKNKILFAEVEPQLDVGGLEKMGVIYWGYLKDSGLHIYTYDEWYVDDDTGLEAAMVPGEYVLLGNPAARTTLYYGAWTEAVKETNSVITVVGERYAKSWVEDDPSVRWVQMISRPLPVPNHIDAFRVLKVV